ncbi:MAG: hypothetical protein Kow0056_00230 [Coriobacteriia bacterium]
MRRLFAAFAAVLVALTLTACGGGSEPTTPADEGAQNQEAPPAPGGGGQEEGAGAADVSPVVEGFPMPFPSDPEVVPSAVQERLDAGQPMLIWYFDSEHDSVDDTRKEIDAVLEDYKGLIAKIEFGVAEDMLDVVENGESLGEDLDEEERADLKKVYKLAGELDIRSTPFIILVDREGTITWMWRGYVDRDTLERQVLYAIQ